MAEPLSKPELREAYALAVLLKKYWAGFIKEYIYGERKGLAGAGYHPSPGADQILIKELIIFFLWILNNTHVDDEEQSVLALRLVSTVHNVYLNGHNNEPMLQQEHENQFGYSSNNSLPLVEMPRVIARYRQYDRALKHELGEDAFAIYQRVVNNMLPVEDFGFMIELFFYAALHQFTEALRKDYRSFVKAAFSALKQSE